MGVHFYFVLPGLLWVALAKAETGTHTQESVANREVDNRPVTAHEEVWQRGNDDRPEGNFETAKFLFRLTSRDQGNGKKQLWLTVEATHSNDFQHVGRDALNYGVESRSVTQMRPYTDDDRAKQRALDKKKYEGEVQLAKLRYNQRTSELEAHLETATKELLAIQEELNNSKLARADQKALLEKLEKKQEEVLAKLRIALRNQDKGEIKKVEKELRTATLDLQEAQAVELPEPNEAKLTTAAKSESAARKELNERPPFSPPAQPRDDYDSIKKIGHTGNESTPRMSMFQYKDRQFQKTVLASGHDFKSVAGQTIQAEVALGEVTLQPTTTDIVGEARIRNGSDSIPKHMLRWRASVENGNLTGFSFEPYQVNGTPTKDSWRFESGTTILPDGTREQSKRVPDQPLPQKANRPKPKP